MKPRLIMMVFLVMLNAPVYAQTGRCDITWLPAVMLSPDTLHDSYVPTVAVQGDTIHVTWYQYGSWALQVPYKRSVNGGLSFEETRELVPFDSVFSVVGGSRVIASATTVYVFYLKRIRPVRYPSMWLRRSFNRGETWEAPQEILANQSNMTGLAVLGDTIAVLFQYDDSLNCGGYKVLSSTDGGASWRVGAACLNVGSPTIALSRNWLHVVYQRRVSGCSQSLEVQHRRSSDLGMSWGDSTIVSTCDNFNSGGPVIAAAPDGNLYVNWEDARYGCALYGCTICFRRSTDEGSTWLEEQVLSDFISRAIQHISERNPIVAAAWMFGHSTTGLHIEARVSFNRARDWCPVVDLTPFVNPTSRALNSWSLTGERFVAVAWEQSDTVGGSFHIWCRVGLFPPVAVKEEPRANRERYQLKAAYPNPFNATTVISFHLPAGQAGLRLSNMVTLKVYDLFGREVATLVDRKLEAGDHEVEWNAAGFASGVYFYRFTTEKITATGKALLLK